MGAAHGTEAAVSVKTERVVTFVYTNHRGETRERTVEPFTIFFGEEPWHCAPTWLLKALDVEKGEVRTFDLARAAGPWRRP